MGNNLVRAAIGFELSKETQTLKQNRNRIEIS